MQQEDYARADELQGQVPDARVRYGEAQAQYKALALVVADVEQRRREHDAAVHAERVKAQAQRTLSAATQRERELTDELSRKRAEIEAGIAAVQQAIHEGDRLEQAVRQARSDINQAMVDLGERAAGTHVPAPNHVSAWVDRSPVLAAIHAGQALSLGRPR